MIGLLKRRLDIVVPDLFDAGGGIARISRAMVLAFATHADTLGLKLTVHALCDADAGESRDLRYLPAHHDYRAYSGDRRRLAAAVLMSMNAPRHALSVFGHVNLAVLALGSRPSLTRRGLRQRYAVVAHGVEVWCDLSRARRMALTQAAEVWPISAFTADSLSERHGVAPSRLKVIPNALDPFWELSAPPESESESAPLFLTVTRLTQDDDYKGVDHTITAFAAARAHLAMASARLIIVGDGDDRARLEALASTHDLGDAVRFEGRVTWARLEALYSQCRALVLPSNGEGFGLVYVEAMARAKACVAANSGGAPEVVIDGKTGVVIEYGDIAALTQALQDLASDPALATRYGTAGLARVTRQFTFARYRDDLACALRRLI